jgi:hypothetical protein
LLSLFLLGLYRRRSIDHVWYFCLLNSDTTLVLCERHGRRKTYFTREK